MYFFNTGDHEAVDAYPTCTLPTMIGILARIAVPGETADRASTVPLWESTTGRCTEHDGGQPGHSPSGGARAQYHDV